MGYDALLSIIAVSYWSYNVSASTFMGGGGI